MSQVSQATHWRKLIPERGAKISDEDFSALSKLIDERDTELGRPEVTLNYFSNDGELPYRFNLAIFVHPVEEFDLFGSRLIWSSPLHWDFLGCVALVPKKLLDEFHAAIERDPNGHDPTDVDRIRRRIEIEISKILCGGTQSLDLGDTGDPIKIKGRHPFTGEIGLYRPLTKQ